jgi:hypothetical protein
MVLAAGLMAAPAAYAQQAVSRFSIPAQPLSSWPAGLGSASPYLDRRAQHAGGGQDLVAQYMAS